LGKRGGKLVFLRDWHEKRVEFVVCSLEIQVDEYFAFNAYFSSEFGQIYTSNLCSRASRIWAMTSQRIFVLIPTKGIFRMRKRKE